MTAKDRIDNHDVTSDRRVDGPVDVIDEGVVIAAVDGVGPAIDHMADAGVDRETALRVMSGPEYHREPRTGTVTRVLQFIAARLWSRKH